MLRFLFAAIMVLTPSLADACFRCGNYRACHYIKPAVPVYVQPAQAVVNTYVVQNAYPNTIGAGNTGYVSNGGVAQSILPFFNQNAYLAGVLEVQKAAQSSIVLSANRADQLAAQFASLQSPAVERLAAGQAAEMVLNAAGLVPTAQTAQHNAVLINRDQQGRVQILQLDQQQIAAVNGQINGGQQYQQQQQQQNPYPILTQFCGRCHDPTLIAQPKGSIAIGPRADAATMERSFFKISRAVSTGKMPPSDQPQMNQEQRIALFNELESLISGGQQPQVQPAQELPPQPQPPGM